MVAQLQASFGISLLWNIKPIVFQNLMITLTTAIEQYENDVLKLFPVRSTDNAVVFLQSLMNRKHLKSNDLARILHISENEFSEIMHHQKPFTFKHAERIKKAFDVEATFILQAA